MNRNSIKRFPLADTVLTSLSPENKEYRVKDSQYLYFRVKPTGNKSWQLRYKNDAGNWSWLGLGTYPQVSAIKARQKASELVLKLSNGYAPQEERKQRLRNSKETFKLLADEWLETKKNDKADNTIRSYTIALKRPLAKFGSRPYKDITTSEWMDFFKEVEQLGIYEQVKKIRLICKEMYDLARVTGRIESNPIYGLHRFLKSGVRKTFAHVSLKELPKLLYKIDRQNSVDTKINLWLLAMLAVRPSELRAATWSEFDLDNALWTIPAERMKKSRDHIVPLPIQAVKLLEVLKVLNGRYELIYPSTIDENKPRDTHTYTRSLAKLGYARRQTGHGFRHIFSTILNEHGFNPDHIEMQLSHHKDDVRSAYNKALYLDQRRDMMQWYADYLNGLLNEYKANIH